MEMKRVARYELVGRLVNTNRNNVNLELVEEVLDFIDETVHLFEETPLYTEHGVEAENYFCRGGCGHFYTILKAQFPQANPYITDGASHVLTEIDGVLYDVRGVYEGSVTTSEPIPTYMEKFVTGYSFSTNISTWFSSQPGGPAVICCLQAIEFMTRAERKALFNYLDSIREGMGDFYRKKYGRYRRQEPEIMSVCADEAEGIYFPFFEGVMA